MNQLVIRDAIYRVCTMVIGQLLLMTSILHYQQPTINNQLTIKNSKLCLFG